MVNKYELKVTGKNLKSFIKYLYKSKIELEHVKYFADFILIVVDEDNYKKIIKVKTSHPIIINRYFGINKFKNMIKTNQVFLISNLLGLLLIIFLSKLIFCVDIITDNKELKEIINSYLISEDISLFKFKRSYKYNRQVIAHILNDHKDKFEWIEIELSGVKVIVKLEARKINTPETIKNPAHIVAKKDAVILKIEARDGEVIKKVNDYVKKGDIIISGQIHKGDDVKKNVSAKGSVYGEVWYKVKVEIPKNYSELNYSSNTTYNLNYQLFNKKKAILPFISFKRQSYQTIFKIENNILPFSISFDKEKEIKYSKSNFTNKELYKKAIDLADLKIKKMFSKKEKIISRKELKKEVNESKIELELFYKVYEDITNYLVIPKEG
ncbi:MAG: sporulation protein YqfD [Bacilli bacterium]